jgi:hypothetical protein
MAAFTAGHVTITFMIFPAIARRFKRYHFIHSSSILKITFFFIDVHEFLFTPPAFILKLRVYYSVAFRASESSA